MLKIREDFIRQQVKVNDWEYLCSVILTHAAPTVARVKPASLIGFPDDGRSLIRLWDYYQQRFLNEIAPRLHLDYFEMQRTEETVFGLFYNDWLLKRILQNKQNSFFLFTHGLNMVSMLSCLESLKESLHRGFPHEIGVLLGYPLEDVLGFIEHRGQNALFEGYWKVYNHPGMAARIFRRYQRAEQIVFQYYLERWKRNKGEI